MSYINKGSMPVTVTVTREPDRSGNFTCDGTADEVQIQAALNMLSGTVGGTVKLKHGYYNIADPITIPRNDSSYPIGLICEPGTVFNVVAGFAGDVLSVLNGAETCRQYVIQGIFFIDSGALATKFIKINNVRYIMIRDIRTYGDIDGPHIELGNDSHWPRLDSIALTGVSIGLRLGVGAGDLCNAGTVTNYAFTGTNAAGVIGIDIPSPIGAHVIHGGDIEGANIGVRIGGGGCNIQLRFEGGYGPGGAVVTPFSLLDTSNDNIFTCLQGQAGTARRYCQNRGKRNMALQAGWVRWLNSIFAIEMAVNTPEPPWKTTFAALGSWATSILYDVLSTGVNAGGISILDVGKTRCIGLQSHFPWVNMCLDPQHITDVEIKAGLFYNADNYVCFFFNPAVSANWLGRVRRTAANSDTDTGVAGATGIIRFGLRFENNGLTVRYLINGNDVGTDTIGADMFMRPWIGISNTNGADKQLHVYSYELWKESNVLY